METPFRTDPEPASPDLIRRLNREQSRHGARTLESVAASLARIRRTRRASRERTHAWVEHPDERVAIEMFRQHQRRDILTYERWATRTCLERALAAADRAGEVWTPLLDVLGQNSSWWYRLARPLNTAEDRTPAERVERLVPWLLSSPRPADLERLLTFDSEAVWQAAATHVPRLEASTFARLIDRPATLPRLARNDALSAVQRRRVLERTLSLIEEGDVSQWLIETLEHLDAQGVAPSEQDIARLEARVRSGERAASRFATEALISMPASVSVSRLARLERPDASRVLTAPDERAMVAREGLTPAELRTLLGTVSFTSNRTRLAQRIAEHPSLWDDLVPRATLGELSSLTHGADDLEDEALRTELKTRIRGALFARLTRFDTHTSAVFYKSVLEMLLDHHPLQADEGELLYDVIGEDPALVAYLVELHELPLPLLRRIASEQGDIRVRTQMAQNDRAAGDSEVREHLARSTSAEVLLPLVRYATGRELVDLVRRTVEADAARLLDVLEQKPREHLAALPPASLLPLLSAPERRVRLRATLLVNSLKRETTRSPSRAAR